MPKLFKSSKPKLKFLLLVFILIISGYYIFRFKQIGGRTWKYSDGNPILGDIADLDYSFSGVFSGLIYVNGVSVAKLTDFQYRFIDEVIVIESLDGKYQGRYCSK